MNELYNKGNLLITWNSSTFEEVILPLFDRLSIKFKIFILFESEVSQNVIDQLQQNNNIEYIGVVPKDSGLVKSHFFMRRVVAKLKPYDFKVWLTLSTMLPYQRYISDCVISEKCITVCSWHQMTYVLMRQQKLAKQLLGLETKSHDQDIMISNFYDILIKKYRNKEVIKSTITVMFTILPKYIIKKVYYFLDRIMLPLVMVKKAFLSRPFDHLTQIGCGSEDYIVFSDDIEVLVHRKLMGKPTFIAADFNHQKCKKTTNNNYVLCVLSGWEKDKYLPEDILFLYARELQTVLTESDSQAVHLRPHPSSPEDGWSKQLLCYLRDRGIIADIVSCEKTISSVACNYNGVVGFASAALRDARRSCDSIFVVGFSSISKYHFHFKDPSFAFGNSEGIGWIDEDGNHDPMIFINEYRPKKRANLGEIVNNL